MSTGIRSVLSYSKVYDFFQWLMGAKRGRHIFATEYIRARDGNFVLDVGCGTADVRFYLPNVEYIGIEPDAHYADAANNRLKEAGVSGKVLQGLLDEQTLEDLPKFDIIIISGVFHHLSDEDVIKMAELSKQALKPGGRLISIAMTVAIMCGKQINIEC